ncbi:hypothetical protein [Polyangium sp. 15x6]|uniref:hypothetical protein n=1 Tax=Polyangium sp. 15x6 TaxID=3042687 RepID=UPI00249C9718|nr:hypothetical protein [Polyangium sp. 15x6]MDI3281969.1 hypothetical protein [Polyangium sp. 15x6]
MRAITIASVLGLCAGCGGAAAPPPSPQDVAKVRAEYEAQAERNLERALAEQHQRDNLKPLSVKKIAHGPGNPPNWKPPGSPDAPYKHRYIPKVGEFVQLKPEDHVQFHGSFCMIGSSCGCQREMKYHFAEKPDGTLVVLVPEAQQKVHTITYDGPCSFGCGQPGSGPMVSIWEFPTTDFDRVTGIVVPFERHVVVETCTKPIPAP